MEIGTHDNSEIPQSPPARLNASQWRAVLAHSPLFFEVVSDSMSPTFRAGEHVQIRPSQQGEPQRGQVLAYFRTMLVTHRYLGDGICRGDAFLDNDAPINSEDIVGIVTHVRRSGRVLPIDKNIPLRTRIRRFVLHARRISGRISSIIRV